MLLYSMSVMPPWTKAVTMMKMVRILIVSDFANEEPIRVIPSIFWSLNSLLPVSLLEMILVRCKTHLCWKGKMIF